MKPDAVDYVDRYAIDLPESMDAPRFAALVLESAPRWLERVLAARDLLVHRFGFTTQERNYGEPVRVVPGRRYGPLKIRTVSPERVQCGDTDAHLAFTATFETQHDGRVGIFTTEVRFKDNLGRAYFSIIKPFHRRIIPRLIAAPFPTRAHEHPIQ